MSEKEKKCFKCGQVKSLSDFYKHKAMADGHVNKCKECNKLDVSNNRNEKINYYRDYDRKRGNRQSAERRSEYVKKYPMKHRAHRMVSNAVRDGRIKRETKCQECGSDFAVHAHHDDYAYPLSVRWLCAACHKQWHKVNGEAPNGN